MNKQYNTKLTLKGSNNRALVAPDGRRSREAEFVYGLQGQFQYTV